MEEKESLLKQQLEGEALLELQNHHGWKEFVRLLTDMYNDRVVILITKESPEAREGLKVLETIAERIKLKIDFGKAAKEELKSQRFNLTQATP